MHKYSFNTAKIYNFSWIIAYLFIYLQHKTVYLYVIYVEDPQLRQNLT
nr:MAG TPA: hypothetical protein [Caudoviricetes sp.]